MVDVKLLTDLEIQAIDTLGRAAELIRQVIQAGGEPGVIRGDWEEAAALIHGLQRMVMSQAAARAHPYICRPLGSKGAWSGAMPVDGTVDLGG